MEVRIYFILSSWCIRMDEKNYSRHWTGRDLCFRPTALFLGTELCSASSLGQITFTLPQIQCTNHN